MSSIGRRIGPGNQVGKEQHISKKRCGGELVGGNFELKSVDHVARSR